MEIKESIRVTAEPQKVWALISDPHNAAQYNPMVKEIVGLQPGAASGVGTRWTAIANLMGKMEIANEITQWEPPHRLSIAMDGPASGVLTFMITPEGDGSRVDQVATSDMPAVAAPLVKPMLEQNLKESLRRIKATVESETAPK